MVGHADAFGGPTQAASPSPRPASTVMVVRDGDHPIAPLEVLMVRRSARTKFAGGAHVFPGGALEAEDARADASCDGLDDGRASAALGLPSGGLAYWVAAVRECFEEAGLLYARTRPQGPMLALADLAVAGRFASHRLELNSRRRSLLDVCATEEIFLALDRLHYFAHWITPREAPRRYDTRFFVAAVPEGQTAAHDAGETVAHAWLRPADALEAHRSGTMVLMPPTVRNLQALERFSTAAELLDAAARIEDVPAIEPRVKMGPDGMSLLVPGDPGYDDPSYGDAGNVSLVGADFDSLARLAARRASEQ